MTRKEYEEACEFNSLLNNWEKNTFRILGNTYKPEIYIPASEHVSQALDKIFSSKRILEMFEASNSIYERLTRIKAGQNVTDKTNDTKRNNPNEKRQNK